MNSSSSRRLSSRAFIAMFCALIALALPRAAGSQQEADPDFTKAMELITQKDYAGALPLMQKSLETARKAGNQQQVFPRLASVGECYLGLARYPEAIGCFTEGMAVAEKIDDTLLWRRGMMLMNSRLGFTYHLMKDRLKSISHYQAAREWAEKAGEMDSARKYDGLTALGYGLLADQLIETGDYGKSLEYFNISKSIHEKLGDTRQVARTYESISRMYFFKSSGMSLANLKKLRGPEDLKDTDDSSKADIAMSIEFSRKALSIWRELNDTKAIADTLAGIAGSYASTGNHEASFNYNMQALAAEQGLDRNINRARLHRSTGSQLTWLGRYREASEHLDAALRLAKELNDERLIADTLADTGRNLREAGDIPRAIECYTRVLAMENDSADRERVYKLHYEIGSLQLRAGNLGAAADCYGNASAIARELNSKKLMAEVFHKEAHLLFIKEDYDAAIDRARKAIELNDTLGRSHESLTLIMMISLIHNNRGEFDRSVAVSREGLEAAKKARDMNLMSAFCFTMAETNMAWGKNKEAIDGCREGIALLKQGTDPEDAAFRGSMANLMECEIGIATMRMLKMEEARQILVRALADAERNNYGNNIPLISHQMGIVYIQQKKFDDALAIFNRELAAYRGVGKFNYIYTLFSIASVHALKNDRVSALKKFDEALELAGSLGLEPLKTTIHFTRGICRYEAKDLSGAMDDLRVGIAIIEKLRKTAPGETRRDYLQSQITSYQLLASYLMNSGDAAGAFDTIELSSAKYLAEQLSGGREEAGRFPGISRYINELDPDTAIVACANAGSPMGVLQIAADRAGISGLEVKQEASVKAISSRFKESIGRETLAQRGVRARRPVASSLLSAGGLESTFNLPSGPATLEESEYMSDYMSRVRGDMEAIINYYRMLLTKAQPTADEKAAMDFIGRELYRLLLGGIEDRIRDKKELVIIPGGILGYLPFEALVMPDGRYLVEKYRIHYTQSLGVSALIRERTYPANRRGLLALGGATYDRLKSSSRSVTTGEEMDALAKEARRAIAAGRSLRNAYDALGMSNWTYLPGTLDEVREIGAVIKGGETITGDRASEDNIKELSRRGTLKEYRVLHFATHGLAVPAVPELSTLVLTLKKEPAAGEDGFLTMKEIAGLSINADLVNLSACETGLGRIYGGEGVVGLTQSFLVAGANGLSVSLWKVDDTATRDFMTGMYRLAAGGMDYDSAITEMKRRFISGKVGGGRYASPYYWAPFVYYGN